MNATIISDNYDDLRGVRVARVNQWPEGHLIHYGPRTSLVLPPVEVVLVGARSSAIGVGQNLKDAIRDGLASLQE